MAGKETCKVLLKSCNMAALIRYNNVKLRKTLQNRRILRQICKLGGGRGVRGGFSYKEQGRISTVHYCVL